jgi:aminopeptidase
MRSQLRNAATGGREKYMDPRVDSLAAVLVNYSLSVKPGDWVVIQSPLLGEPLADACTRAVLKAGGNPTTLFTSELINETTYRTANDEQLRFISPFARATIEHADARISILAPSNTHALSAVDPTRLALSRQAAGPLQELMLQRTAEGSFNWTISAYPTQAAAQDANMSLAAYEDFVFGAGLLGEPNPIEAWKAVGERQARLIEWITPRKDIHILAPGTDLHLSVEGRTWLNDEGRRNFPGGEIFTAPIEDSVNGTVEFSFPAFYAGREVQGVRLAFKDGIVTDATARGDESFLHQMLAMDDGAKRLGEFAFGTNPGIQQFTKNTLFDEKMGGTLHMALGAAYPESGGRNKSALHWDMVLDLRKDAQVTVDGELFSLNGEFQVLRETLAAR